MSMGIDVRQKMSGFFIAGINLIFYFKDDLKLACKKVCFLPTKSYKNILIQQFTTQNYPTLLQSAGDGKVATE